MQSYACGRAPQTGIRRCVRLLGNVDLSSRTERRKFHFRGRRQSARPDTRRPQSRASSNIQPDESRTNAKGSVETRGPLTQSAQRIVGGRASGFHQVLNSRNCSRQATDLSGLKSSGPSGTRTCALLVRRLMPVSYLVGSSVGYLIRRGRCSLVFGRKSFTDCSLRAARALCPAAHCICHATGSTIEWSSFNASSGFQFTSAPANPAGLIGAVIGHDRSGMFFE